MKTVPPVDDFPTLYEEWNARYRKVDEAIGEGAQDEAALHRLVASSIAVRAGRLESLQCALFDNDNNDPASVEALLDYTRLEMDQQAASKAHLQVMDRLVSHCRVGSSSSRSSDKRRHNFKIDDHMDVEADVDAFFAEYPECMRSDGGEVSSDDHDSDDESVEELEMNGHPGSSNKPAKAQRHPQGSDRQAENTIHHHNGHSLVTPGSVRSNPSQIYDSKEEGTIVEANEIHNPNPHQQSGKDLLSRRDTHGPPSGIPFNPYSKGSTSRKEDGEPKAFSYTPPLQRPSSASSASASQKTQQANNQWNTHHRNQAQIAGPNNNDTYKNDGNYRYSSYPNNPPPPPPSTYIASRSSWEDHQNNQNPFQTAREFAQSGGGHGGDSQQTRHTPHPPPSRSSPTGPTENPYARGDDRQSRVPEYFSNSNTANHIQNPYCKGQSNHHEDTVPTNGGGPKIPESLKRKFQKPTRVGKPAGETGTTKEASTSRQSVPSQGGSGGVTGRPSGAAKSKEEQDDELPEELQHLDKELVKKIENEILESGEMITFNQIAGLEDAKQTVYESVCWPMQRPDIYTGLRKAPTGVLLYGPPGTGKTLIGKAIAHESKATFFSISSSSLTSKWIGEGEKLVKTLFAVARYRKPAVIFIDEIDSLLTQRTSNENEASRRIKTEFLVQIDGAATGGASDTGKEGHVLTIGATNRPQELDEAARRRFTKRMYIPLPTEQDRAALFHVLLGKNQHCLRDEDFATLAKETDGFSGADLKALCNDAALWPIRQLGSKALEVNVNDIPPISFKHCRRSLKGMKPSVSPADLVQYEEWDRIYGTRLAPKDLDEDDDSEDDASKDNINN